MIYTDIKNGRFYNEDCFDAMREIPDGVIDMIMCDLPYGTTQNKWDSVLPLDKLWAEYRRVCKDNAAIVLCGTEPFSSHMRLSNLKNFKYDWIWNKTLSTGFLNSKKRPLKIFELISVFYKEQPTYNPQMWESKPMNTVYKSTATETTNYGKTAPTDNKRINTTERFPIDIININQMPNNSNEKIGHPTQKPVALFEYLIKTYTNEGELVLDNTAGSGTTAIAAINTNRKWVCIEKDKDYYDKAIDRIEKHVITA